MHQRVAAGGAFIAAWTLAMVLACGGDTTGEVEVAGTNGCKADCDKLKQECGVDANACMSRCMKFVEVSGRKCGEAYDALAACRTVGGAPAFTCDGGTSTAPGECQSEQSTFECACLQRC